MGDVPVYTVAVEVDGRDLVGHIKEGVVGSIETGLLNGTVEVPQHRVDIIVGQTSCGPVAWVQVSHADANGHYVIRNQGWIRPDAEALESTISSESTRASIARMTPVDAKIMECQQEIVFGSTDCCKAHGDGCWIKCCAVCCSDPTACPDASCCP